MKTASTWTVANGLHVDLNPFLVVGIVNVTPDSFYDGNLRAEAGKATAWARTLYEHGARMVDIGGESTRPYASPVSEAEEMDRVLPVVRELRQTDPDILVSVDTTKAGVAAACLKAGAHVINDVSACSFDPGLLDVVAQYGPGYVLMHTSARPDSMQDDPRYHDVVDEICQFFEDRLTLLTSRGIPEEKIVLDPGIGFGKRLEHNLEILRRIESFFNLGRPLYMGLSNKSLWTGLLGVPADRRRLPTQVATALLAARGVRVHRVHEVEEAVQALEVTMAMEAC